MTFLEQFKSQCGLKKQATGLILSLAHSTLFSDHKLINLIIFPSLKFWVYNLTMSVLREYFESERLFPPALDIGAVPAHGLQCYFHVSKIAFPLPWNVAEHKFVLWHTMRG